MEIKSINTEMSSKEMHAKLLIAKQNKMPSKKAIEFFRRPAYPNMKRRDEKNE